MGSTSVENRLADVKQGSTTLASFVYDGQGRRVQKVAGGVTTTYVHDGADIIEQASSSGGTLHYVHGAGVDQHWAVQDGSGTMTYYLSDHLGSVVQMTNASGATTLARDYDPFGSPLAGSTTAGYAFTGREWNPEVGLYYYRARYYDAAMGRFISEDPIGFDDGLNLYAYVRNRPDRLIDPTGTLSNPLNPTETKYCQEHPLTCLAASPCRLFSEIDQNFVGADQWTKQGGFPDNGPLNAWKHCNWACCMTRLMGADAAATITENHEADQKRSQPCESRMDTMNNRVGINAAAGNPMTGCHDLCTNSKLQCSPPPAPCPPFGR